MQLFCRSALMVAVSATASFGQEERPIGGAVYNLSVGERLNYYCVATSDTEISCDFTQSTVVYQLSPERHAERLAEELKLMDEPGALEEFAKGSCEALERLETAKANGELKELDYMPQADVSAMLAAFRGVCEKRTRDAAETFISYNLDIETRTCIVNTFDWKSNFVKSSDDLWVRTDKDPPKADGCGGVYLDRFEREDGYMWNLTTRSISSNPNGTFTSGEKCSAIYTGKETFYTWSPVDFPMRCDYIKLSVF